MIRRVVLKDFLSYQDAVVDLDGSTIAVTGENGMGKSSLLEAIPYAYFGIGRETMAGMSRIGGDGSHLVSVWETDTLEIRRGRKKGGTGFFEIRDDGNLVAKGREADEWVKAHLGMDGDTFMLTAFFGLHDSHHDQLIRVQPAPRLEALQKFAEIGPYNALLKEAKVRVKDTDILKGRVISRREGMEAAMVDEDEVREKIADSEELLEQANKRMLKLKSQKGELLIEEEKYQAFVKEKAALGAERKALDREIRDLEREKEEIEERLDDTRHDADSYIEERDGLELPDIDVDDKQAEIASLRERIGKTRGRLEILEERADLGNECPMCGHAVTDNQIAEWARERDELESWLKTSKLTLDGSSQKVEEYRRISKRLETLKRMIDDATSQSATDKKRLSEIDLGLRRLMGDKSKKDNRFIDLQEKLGKEYDQLHRDLEKVNSEIDTESDIISGEKKEIQLRREGLKKSTQIKKDMADLDKEIREHSTTIKVAKVLAEAWSRYGIPMRLVKQTMRNIEEQATAVYQEFDNGRIMVSEVEDRGKPGVEFFLVDQKGQRTFNQLSAGEKVMFFISIRVAISQIVTGRRDVSVDYLILDEAMGNLSPKRRDDLIRLINKTLRKIYPQVMMVSHTEMRDIFSHTFRVSAENGTSKVEIVQ